MELSHSPPRLADAHGYLDRIIRELRVLHSPQKDTLVGVLQYLSDHIRATREEIIDALEAILRELRKRP